MFDGNFRPQVEAKLKPVGHQIKRTGITADHLTIAGLVMAVAAAVVISLGWWHLGLLLVVLTGVPDLLDGAVAKASGTAAPEVPSSIRWSTVSPTRCSLAPSQ
ncbi:MAG: CDP-alcohol phosphatidyltransferase family protein [Candidatus Microthrix sp.]|nr:CDP-alcohol phosphatidyltransferase family protein [Candidatus Microthrix sp.]MBK6502805.1 CDP-alcohol phosphatidyltransferase family protein [Candidatus Microthrix sp.]